MTKEEDLVQVWWNQQQSQCHRDRMGYEPMNAEEASRKRSAEDAGHEADVASRGGAQPDPGSMVDDSIRLGWDLGQRADQVKAEKSLNDERLHLLIFSPRCLSHSRLQHTKPDELAELREQGKRHLEFACSLARLQIERGGRFLFEYPLAASEEKCLWKLRSIDGMLCIRCDQCQFGLTSVDLGQSEIL